MVKTYEQKAREYILEKYIDNITYDNYKSVYYHNNEELDIEDLMYDLMTEEGIKVTPDILRLILRKECRTEENRLQHYLNCVHLEYGENDAINVLCEKVLRCRTKIEKIYVRKFLIGAVARVFQPGCKMDNMLILYSKDQGVRKSTFFSALVTLENLVTTSFSMNNIELRKQCTNYWLAMFDEIDSALSAKKISEVKAFITDQKDTYRAYYQTDKQIDRLRTFVTCGTTNKKELLVDSGKERRFWVIEIKKEIDHDWVENNRDRIWSQAVHLYRSGEQWWLTKEEQQLSNKLNQTFKDTDPYDNEIVECALAQRNKFTLEMIAKELNVPNIERRKFYKYAKNLIESRTNLKYPKKQTSLNGTRGYWWEPITYGA